MNHTGMQTIMVSTKSVNIIDESIEKLTLWIEDEKFAGYDIYDGLNSPYFSIIKNHIQPLAFAVMQITKRSPINLRPLLLIKKGFNPKSLGILLHAYTILWRVYKKKSHRIVCDYLFELILRFRSKGYSGSCWGYNFDYKQTIKYVPKYTPSIVVTSFVGSAIFEYYNTTRNEEAFKVLKTIPLFILNDLPLIQRSEDICISYTPLKEEIVHNANLLGSEILCKINSLNPSSELTDISRRSMDFSVNRQNNDGSWYYRYDEVKKRGKKQFDFHQGYVINSIHEFINYNSPTEDKYENALRGGIDYYRKIQFNENGVCHWRYPKLWPIEIHNQSQGIITFSLVTDYLEGSLDFSKKIAQWTVKNMQSPKGYFYYQKWPLFTNKIPYMRWSSSWMLLALTKLIEKVKKNETTYKK